MPPCDWSAEIAYIAVNKTCPPLLLSYPLARPLSLFLYRRPSRKFSLSLFTPSLLFTLCLSYTLFPSFSPSVPLTNSFSLSLALSLSLSLYLLPSLFPSFSYPFFLALYHLHSICTYLSVRTDTLLLSRRLRLIAIRGTRRTHVSRYNV